MQTQILPKCLLTEAIFTLQVFKVQSFEKVKRKSWIVTIANEKKNRDSAGDHV